MVVFTLGCAAVPEPFVESPSDTDEGGIIQCQARNGTCTSSPEALCDTDAEPLTQNDPENTDCAGHCCVKAEPNMCNEKLEWSCVPEACTAGWRPVDGSPPCAEGRVCCYWGL